MLVWYSSTILSCSLCTPSASAMTFPDTEQAWVMDSIVRYGAFTVHYICPIYFGPITFFSILFPIVYQVIGHSREMVLITLLQKLTVTLTLMLQTAILKVHNKTTTKYLCCKNTQLWKQVLHHQQKQCHNRNPAFPSQQRSEIVLYNLKRQREDLINTPKCSCTA